ncbi:MAG: restriction endonuclease subunit S [Candidatus Aminicenantes bacterium]|nr:restriction endonuclease subunit S [Candidatus Aminicenantes bacterium]
MGDREKFKQTEIGSIPEEWKVMRLEEVFSLEYGKGLIEKERKNGEYPVYGSNGVVGYHSQYIVKGPGIIIGRKGTIGAVTWSDRNFWPIDTTYYIILKIAGTDLKWLFYKLLSLKLAKLNMATGTPGLNRGLVYKLKIPLPPLPEQQKIAEILSRVDEANEKVDDSIEKTERLKKGLMHELLTKGIGHKNFKETEIGRIPKEWQVLRLESLINEIRNGFASGKRDENGIVQIRMNNVTTDGHLVLDTYLKVPIPRNVDDWILKEGDFLFNNTNSYDLVGKSAIFKGVPFRCTFSNHFTRIRFKMNLVIPEIILFHFILLWEKGFFKSIAIRHVGQSAVHTKHLLRLKLPLPPLPEQKKIAEILSTVDKRLELLRSKKAKLERIKKGLMNDLLTGQRRVKILES